MIPLANAQCISLVLDTHFPALNARLMWIYSTSANITLPWKMYWSESWLSQLISDQPLHYWCLLLKNVALYTDPAALFVSLSFLV